jgi:plasmid stability protein
VDLGSVDLVKSLRIAAVEHGRTVRDIVVEALEAWLERSGMSAEKGAAEAASPQQAAGSADKDYKSMLETLNRYRGGSS